MTQSKYLGGKERSWSLGHDEVLFGIIHQLQLGNNFLIFTVSLAV